MRVKPAVEADILAAVQLLYSNSKQERPIITKIVILREIAENSQNYPNIQPYSLPIRRGQVTEICNRRFIRFSQNWRNGAWVVTPEALP